MSTPGGKRKRRNYVAQYSQLVDAVPDKTLKACASAPLATPLFPPEAVTAGLLLALDGKARRMALASAPSIAAWLGLSVGSKAVCKALERVRGDLRRARGGAWKEELLARRLSLTSLQLQSGLAGEASLYTPAGVAELAPELFSGAVEEAVLATAGVEQTAAGEVERVRKAAAGAAEEARREGAAAAAAAFALDLEVAQTRAARAEHQAGRLSAQLAVERERRLAAEADRSRAEQAQVDAANRKIAADAKAKASATHPRPPPVVGSRGERALVRELTAKNLELTAKDRELAVKDGKLAAKDRQIVALKQSVTEYDVLKDKLRAAQKKSNKRLHASERHRADAAAAKVPLLPRGAGGSEGGGGGERG